MRGIYKDAMDRQALIVVTGEDEDTYPVAANLEFYVCGLEAH